MTGRKTLDQMNSNDLDQLHERLEFTQAALDRVRALSDRWNLDGPPPGNRPFTELRAALAEPAPARSGLTLDEARRIRDQFIADLMGSEHCGHLSPETPLTSPPVACVLPPGHEDHIDDRGVRWRTTPEAAALEPAKEQR
jgi:hypothetical protein